MRKLQLFFYGQGIHYSLLLFLLIGILTIVQDKSFVAGGLWGVPTAVWFWLAVACAIVHQTYVWLGWRLELHYGVVSPLFHGRGFFYFSRISFLLIILRPVFIILAAIANADSLSLSWGARWLGAVILAVPAGYLFYSVGRDFGFERAVGIDHFDKSYRTKPLAKQGIFKYFRNPMYLFSPLALLAPGWLFASKAALLAAIFAQIYIWIHYFCTEKPDMKFIYHAA